MAGLTKEERAAKEARMQAEMAAKIEEKIKAELEAKIRAEYEEKLNIEKENLKTKAKVIQSSSKIPLDTIVPVTCNVLGGAHYDSQKIKGYSINWDSYGSIEYVELSELVGMKNSYPRFFTDNWIVLEDTEDYSSIQLYDFLKVTKYYENVLTPETIDNIFDLSPSDIIKTISGFSKGMRDTIASRAKAKIDAKELDSNNKIEALETALNVKFSI